MCHTTVCDVAPVVPCPGYMSAVPLSAPCGHVAAMIGAAVVVGRALVPALGRRRARPVFRCGLTVTTPVLVLRSAVASGLSPVLLLPRRVCAAGLARAAFPVGFQSGSSFAFAVRRRGAAAGTDARAFARVRREVEGINPFLFVGLLSSFYPVPGTSTEGHSVRSREPRLHKYRALYWNLANW